MSSENLLAGVRGAVESLLGPEKASRFSDDDMWVLKKAGYDTLEDLKHASHTGLAFANLKPARADLIVNAQGRGRPDNLRADALSISLHALKQVAEELKQVASVMKRRRNASQSHQQFLLHGIRQVLHVMLAPEPDDPTVPDLFQAQGEAHAAQADIMWHDEVVEEWQSDAAMAEIKEKLGGRVSPQPSSHQAQVQWFGGRMALSHCFGGVPYFIKSKNDGMLGVVTSCGYDAAGAVLGVQLVKKLSSQSVRQAETEFYLWQSSSQYPYCQVITDMKVGCAYYAEGVNRDGYLVLRVRAFGGMEPLYDFMAGLAAGLPPDLNDQLPPPLEFSAPHRIKPPPHAPRAEGSASVPPFTAVLKLIAEMRDAEDDIASLRDD